MDLDVLWCEWDKSGCSIPFAVMIDLDVLWCEWDPVDPSAGLIQSLD